MTLEICAPLLYSTCASVNNNRKVDSSGLNGLKFCEVSRVQIPEHVSVLRCTYICCRAWYRHNYKFRICSYSLADRQADADNRIRDYWFILWMKTCLLWWHTKFSNCLNTGVWKCNFYLRPVISVIILAARKLTSNTNVSHRRSSPLMLAYCFISIAKPD